MNRDLGPTPTSVPKQNRRAPVYGDVYSLAQTRKSLARLGIMVAGVVLFLLAASLVQMPLHHNGLPDAIAAPIAAVAFLLVYWAIERFLERRNATEIGAGGLPWIFAGLAYGVLLFAATIAILTLAHSYAARYAGMAPGLFLTELLIAAAGAIPKSFYSVASCIGPFATCSAFPPVLSCPRSCSGLRTHSTQARR